MNTNIKKIVYLTLIAGRKSKDDLISFLEREGGRIINVLYGKGALKANYFLDMLGLVHEENKVIITCLLLESKRDLLLTMLEEEFHFDKMNTGIAYSIAVDKISF